MAKQRQLVVPLNNGEVNLINVQEWISIERQILDCSVCSSVVDLHLHAQVDLEENWKKNPNRIEFLVELLRISSDQKENRFLFGIVQ